MPYVTSVERIAERRGEARGAALFAARMLVKMLRPRLTDPPADLVQLFQIAPLAQQESILDRLAEVHSWEDVRTMLSSEAAPPEGEA